MAYLLHQLLTESATRLPDKEAVRFSGKSLSYSQLDRVTNQLARKLCELGVRRGDRVGIFVHKSLASVVAVFGIMKAGGVYVPLDPGAPAKRLAYITRNCGIRVLLTSSEKLKTVSQFFDEGTPVEALVLMNEGERASISQETRATIVSWHEVRAQDDGPPPPAGTIDTDLAYILYTSGSTGDPKGVMISHRTIFVFINWACETFGLNESDRVTSHAPLHFDLSTFDIYATVKGGGTVVLVPENLSIFPIQLVRLLQDEKITVTYLVPSILSLMVTYGQLERHDLSSLRAVLFAGEVFPIKYLREWVSRVPQAEYYNLYGPTETNVCTYYKVTADDVLPDRTRPVPIGVPCANIEVFAVNGEDRLVTEPGEEGELWVRGSCLAQGYWGDPEKTERTFIANPFQPNYRDIVYRTGDIVMLSEDRANWVYVGRRDHMVKSRGYRIELGEIESVLYAHDEVKEAAVVAIPDDFLGNRIKAFVVPLKENGLTAKDLEIHCRERLPRYMIPDTFQFESALPKTSNGKVNRTLLAAS